MSLRWLSLAALATPSVFSTLSAQVAVERSVSGTIVDSISRRPVRGAVVYFDGQRREVIASRDGRFVIEHVSAGDTVLVVRSIGFVPQEIVVRPSSAVVVDLGTLVVRPVATRLDVIAVEAEAVNRFPHMVDFFRRKQEGKTGEFLTPDDIERSRVRNTSELLSRSAKVQMDCARDAVRSGIEGCIARDRRGLGYKVTSGDPSRCAKEVFIDGKLSMLGVDDVPVDQIAGIEVYAGPATTPANFGQRRCGVIAIWTKGAGQN